MLLVLGKTTCRDARLCVSLLREYQKRRTALRLYRTNVTNPLSS